MSIALLDNFKLHLTLRPYDGIGDSQVLVTIFIYIMLLNKVTNPFLCLVFPTFLEKPAVLWFLE